MSDTRNAKSRWSARLLLGAALMASPLAASTARAEDGDGIVGTWLTEGAAGKIEIFRCGGKYCGRTVWISPKQHPGPGDKLDVNNPDPKKRGRRIIGATILWGLEFNASDGVYEGGSIYDPDRGKTFGCKAWLKDGGRTLFFRGFLGLSLLGKTTTWTRAR